MQAASSRSEFIVGASCKIDRDSARAKIGDMVVVLEATGDKSKATLLIFEHVADASTVTEHIKHNESSSDLDAALARKRGSAIQNCTKGTVARLTSRWTTLFSERAVAVDVSDSTTFRSDLPAGSASAHDSAPPPTQAERPAESLAAADRERKGAELAAFLHSNGIRPAESMTAADRERSRAELTAFLHSKGMTVHQLKQAAAHASRNEPPPTEALSPAERARRRAHAILAHAALERIRTASPSDWHGILGLRHREGVTPADLTKAFRQQSLLVHPDKNTADGAAAAFRKLQAAYELARQAPSQRRQAPSSSSQDLAPDGATQAVVPIAEYGRWEGWIASGAARPRITDPAHRGLNPLVAQHRPPPPGYTAPPKCGAPPVALIEG